MTHTGPSITGKEVWQQLLEGNSRFVEGRPRPRNLAELRKSLLEGQHPLAAVLCCSDSRVPAEVIFDQSLGDIFVVRTAGLVLDPTSLGSLEFAVECLAVPLLVVNGHEFCGAVTTAVNQPDLDKGHMTAVVQKIVPCVTLAQQSGLTGPALVEAANDRHLKALYDGLSRESAIIREALAARRLDLVLAKYFLSSGRVETLEATF
jgi:carbonic anhydrase